MTRTDSGAGKTRNKRKRFAQSPLFLCKPRAALQIAATVCMIKNSRRPSVYGKPIASL